MEFLALWGWLAATTGMISGLPQIIRLLRVRTSAGVSLRLWQLNLASFVAWTAHGVLVGHAQLQFPNGFLVLCGFLVLFMIARDRRQGLLPLLVLPVLLAAGLFAVDYLLGPAVFGLVVAIPGLVGMTAQLRTMVSSPDLSGISPAYLGITLLVQVMWLVWAVPMVEWALMVCASLIAVICLVNLGYWTYRHLTRTDTDEMVPVAG